MSLSADTAQAAVWGGMLPRASTLPQTVILSAAKDPRNSSLRSSAWMRMPPRPVLRSARNDGTEIDSGFLIP